MPAVVVGGGGGGDNATAQAVSPVSFVHVATASNITDNYTVLSYPSIDGKPVAVVMVTQNWNPGEYGTSVYNNHEIGVWYDGYQWGIFNQDLGPMPVGASFTISID